MEGTVPLWWENDVRLVPPLARAQLGGSIGDWQGRPRLAVRADKDCPKSPKGPSSLPLGCVLFLKSVHEAIPYHFFTFLTS
eukprot:scaffold567_cov170-Amphora_coffeaeformis.AAC.4